MRLLLPDPMTFTDCWFNEADRTECQMDLDTYGEAFAMSVGGLFRHIPVESLAIWSRQPAPDTYAESG